MSIRRNMDVSVEVFPVERVHDLLVVPTGCYKLGPDFLRYVIEPAMPEMNSLSDMSVMVEPRRRHAARRCTRCDQFVAEGRE